MSLNFASWNQIGEWLRRLQGLRGAASARMTVQTTSHMLDGEDAAQALRDPRESGGLRWRRHRSVLFSTWPPIEEVWNGFVSKEANRTIFMGADFDADLKPGGSMSWSGPGKDGKPTRYVTGKVLRVEAPNLLEYKFGMGDGTVMSRVRVELASETEAVKVVVTNDEWADDDPAYTSNADGWPRILSRLKTLLETGKTFRPH